MTHRTVGRQPEAAGLPPDASPGMGGTLADDLARVAFILGLARRRLAPSDADTVARWYLQALAHYHGPNWYVHADAQHWKEQADGPRK